MVREILPKIHKTKIRGVGNLKQPPSSQIPKEQYDYIHIYEILPKNSKI
jgi:hypothetical protein